MNTRKIENGIIIEYLDENGTRQQKAFLFDNADWKADAKAFVTEKKGNVANREERNAHNQIDNINDNAEEMV